MESRIGSVLSWGVVGTGQVSSFVSSDLARVDGARLRAVASRSDQRAGEFADGHGFEVGYGSVKELLDDATVNVVYIATPHATHADIAVAALEAGKHILVEKPMAVDGAEVAAITSAARAAGTFAMEAMWMRFNPTYRSMLADLAGGLIGDTRSVRAYVGLPFGQWDSAQWSAERRSSTLLDQMIYAFALARDVLGDPDEMSGAVGTRLDGVDLIAEITLRQGDRFAHLASSMVTFLEPTASVSGTGGWLTLSPPFWGTNGYSRHRGDLANALFAPERHDRTASGYGYTPMLEQVQAAIREGLVEHPWHTLADTASLMRLIELAHTALQWRPVGSTGS